MKTRILLAAAAMGLTLASASGCGSSTPAATSDPNKAKTVLKDVLESWKRGDTIDAASKLSPPVIVADEDWLAGQKLQDYQIESNEKMIGTSLRVPVTITLPNSKAKKKSKTVFYVVTTDPILRVDREDTN